MKKLLILFPVVLLLGATAVAQNGKRKMYGVAFYNLENLFDTIHDEGKNDYDFLPDGSYRWTAEKYEAKLKNLARVLGDMAHDQLPQGPAVIGVAEAENCRVLADLQAQPELEGYKFIHYEGPDKRGIDCALFYRPEQFKVKSSGLVLSQPYQGDTLHPTRGFLIVRGRMAKSKVCFIVNHWPSRGAESPLRVHAARQVKALTDSLQRKFRKMKIIVMGDLNDDPMDESLRALPGRKFRQEVADGEFYNPWWETLQDKGVGTLYYRGHWNLFDQILLSRSLLHPAKGLRYDHSEVFQREYLIQQDGKYKGAPLRTHGGRTWLNGYSDHLPTIVYLCK